MPKKDKRVDAYLEKAAPFAQPILNKLRNIIFKALPDVEETIKWSFPNYEIYGSVVCNMAAFKQHCSFGFWKAALLKDEAGILHVTDKIAMGHLDKITSLQNLPSEKILIAYLQEAAMLNKNNIKLVKAKAPIAKEIPVPDALAAAFKKNKKAQINFASFSPSQRKEYIEWITEAKTEETVQKRVETTVEWSAEGKTRNWKYQKTK